MSTKILPYFASNAVHNFCFLNTVCFCSYYASQKKTLEINPRHGIIKKMLQQVNVRPFAAAVSPPTTTHPLSFC